MKRYRAIGLMSGSSMDGLDVAYCQFEGEESDWNFKILQCEVIEFPTKWKLRLENLVMQNAITYLKTHTFFGHYMAELVSYFINKHQLHGQVDFIANHGQTIFHQPENRLTSQIGDNGTLAALTGIPVIGNFRTKDIALGGQGTPIAPIGDLILWKEYSHCLNLGGIANISFKLGQEKIMGYDICGANLILNILSEEQNHAFDKDGEMAAAGELNTDLLEELNNNWYFEKDYPKSLSGGWIYKVIMPIINNYSVSTKDKLRTACEHIAMKIGGDISGIYEKEDKSQSPEDKMLITGGGAKNKFLISRIVEHSPIRIEIPEIEIIDFKEAIIIALMGVLRAENQENCIASVTGASKNTIGGEIYQGSDKLL